MGSAALIALIFGALVLTPMLTTQDTSGAGDDADDTDDPVEPTDPVDPVDPVDPETLGATFEATDSGITIEFGENETGSLAVVTYVDTEDSEENFLDIHEARYYLVPEGVEWPDNTSETAFNIPGANEYGGNASSYELTDFEDHFGLTFLGTFDLLAAGDDSPTDRDMADSLPELTANRDAEYYYLEANTDGDDLITFLQEGYTVTKNGAEESVITENAAGTGGNDWLSTETTGITLDGAGGDDVLDANATNVSLIGGAGDDTFTANTGAATINGGDGDDQISASDAQVDGGADDDDITLFGGTAFGGAGDDFITTFTDDAVTFYGGDGDDNLSANGAGENPSNATLFGGNGNDFFDIGNGVVANGDAGNDLLQVDAGGTTNGGDGDDTFRLWDFYDNEGGRMIATGGAGADVFNVSVRNATGDATDDVFAEITDFDPDEDMLMVGNLFSGPDVDSIELIEDPSGAFTDVVIKFDVQPTQTGTASTIVRLTGVTDLNPDQVVLQ